MQNIGLPEFDVAKPGTVRLCPRSGQLHRIEIDGDDATRWADHFREDLRDMPAAASDIDAGHAFTDACVD